MELKRIYKALRAKYPAEKAAQVIGFARVALAAGRSEYSPESGTFGTPFKHGGYTVRFTGNYAAAGLRLVGFSDEIAPRAVNHTGWFTRHDGDTRETYRGAVFLVPGRKGVARAVAGYIDSNNESAAIIDCSIEQEEAARSAGRYGLDNSEWRDAAVVADGIAQRAAEEAREYDTAWQAGSYYELCAEELREARKEASEIIKASRVANASGNAVVCRTLKAAVAECRRGMSEALSTMAKLREGDHDSFYWDTGDADKRAAFNEGAGRQVMA